MIELKEIFKVSPERLYTAWLDSDFHSRMTGGEAICSNHVGGLFTAWDGYISGNNKALIPSKTIVQNWRTTEFLVSQDDSELTLHFKECPEGCELTLIHTNIPDGQSDYKNGWIVHYFTPMKEYFSKLKMTKF